MSDIAPINHHTPPLYGPSGGRMDSTSPPHGPDSAAGRLAGETPRPSDRVELSDRARLLSKLASLPDVRQDVVAEMRAQIASGALDTPERLDQALDAMIEDLAT